VVAFAEDQQAESDAADRHVALKVMRHRAQFDREIALRQQFKIDKAVLPVLLSQSGPEVQTSRALPLAADIGTHLLVMLKAEDDLSNYMVRVGAVSAAWVALWLLPLLFWPSAKWSRTRHHETLASAPLPLLVILSGARPVQAV
jgi:hypothetical protein